MTVYNRAAFTAALTKFTEDPASLTDSDIEQFAIVNPKIADRARARRQGFVPAETEMERKALDRPVTRRDVMQVLEDFLFPRLAEHRYLEEQLEARVVSLEKRPAVKFCGTWQRDKSYVVGDAATHHGGLWICQRDTMGEPSQDFVGWRLAVKSGQAR
jgi:hypothetical protein